MSGSWASLPLTLCAACLQGDAAITENAVRESPPPSERKRTPFFGAFFKQLLDPNVSVNDRVTEFFAAALGKAISKMYESMGELWCASCRPIAAGQC